MKKLVFAAALLLSLVGGAGQASADPGTPPAKAKATPTVTPRFIGVTWEGFRFYITFGTTWE